jgi:hypothetical protein
MNHRRSTLLRIGQFYERHRKVINENLGLIVAVLASLAAVYSGIEAHKARLDAFGEAEKQIQIQQQSVRDQERSVAEQIEQGKASIKAQRNATNAQVQAMHLDERPYLSVTAVDDNIHPISVLKRGKDGRLKDEDDNILPIKLQASGRTPALDIKVASVCDSGYVSGKGLTTAARHVPASLAGAPKGLLGAGEIVTFPVTCPRTENPNDNRGSTTTLYGRVWYTDIFGSLHHTTFCLSDTQPLFSNDKRTFRMCPLFVPEVD